MIVSPLGSTLVVICCSKLFKILRHAPARWLRPLDATATLKTG